MSTYYTGHWSKAHIYSDFNFSKTKMDITVGGTLKLLPAKEWLQPGKHWPCKPMLLHLVEWLDNDNLLQVSVNRSLKVHVEGIRALNFIWKPSIKTSFSDHERMASNLQNAWPAAWKKSPGENSEGLRKMLQHQCSIMVEKMMSYEEKWVLTTRWKKLFRRIRFWT